MSKVIKAAFTGYATTVAAALDRLGAADQLPQSGLIIIKPNLTNSSPPPVTTPVEFIEAILDYCRKHSSAEIAIGEGCGSGTTMDCFAANGYTALAERAEVRLIDFNEEEYDVLEDEGALQLKQFHLPRIARDAFIISAPILKDHSMTITSISMKNIFGLAPGPVYQGSWNKSKLHTPSTDCSIVDICAYKKPDLCVVDAITALTGAHLSGTPKKIGLILAGFDPVAVDAVGTRLLGHKPERLEYLTLAEGKVGSMKDIDIVEL